MTKKEAKKELKKSLKQLRQIVKNHTNEAIRVNKLVMTVLKHTRKCI